MMRARLAMTAAVVVLASACTGGYVVDDYGNAITSKTIHVAFSSTTGGGNYGVTMDPGDGSWGFDPTRSTDGVYRRRELIPEGTYVVYAGLNNPCRVDEYYASRLPIEHEYHANCGSPNNAMPCQFYNVYLHRYHAQPGLPLQGPASNPELHMTYYSGNKGLALPGCGTQTIGTGSDSKGSYVQLQCSCSWFHSSEVGKWKWKVY
jgi:hypothetical protein